MAKMLNLRDFDFSNIGSTFELDEVTPKFETEERLIVKGNPFWHKTVVLENLTLILLLVISIQ